MTEFASLIAAIAAVIWARKQDIERNLKDARSCVQLATKIAHPVYQYSRYLSYFGKFLDRYMETVFLSLFFCLMLSLAYSSLSFLFSLAVSGTNYTMLPGVSFPGWQAKLLFLAICAIAMANFVWARMLSRAKSNNVETSRRAQVCIYLYHIIAALWFSFSIYIVLENVPLALIGGGLAVGGAVTQKTFKSNIEIFENWPSIFFGASLGCYGTIIVLFYFLSGYLTTPFILLIATASIVSGVLAVAGVPFTKVGLDRSHVRGAGLFANFFSLLARPGLYVSFYCARAAGSFCFAVSNILWASKILQLFLPEAIVVSASIVLMSSIYFAGAKSIIGAGAFAFMTTILVTAFTFLFQEQLFFEKWPYLFVFWIILPFCHAFVDWIRLNIVRLVIKNWTPEAARHAFQFIVIDFIVGITCIVLFCILVVLTINRFNLWAVDRGFSAPIPIDSIISGIHRNEEGSGLWFVVVASTIMLPTLVSVIVYLAAGIISAVPTPVRESLARQILVANHTENDRDVLAWKIAAAESLSGVIFFAIMLFLFARLVLWSAPPFAELIYRMASWAAG